MANESLPIACDLNAFTGDERVCYEALATAVRSGVREVRELADGFALRLDSSASQAAAEFVLFERRCCPFFRIALEWEPAAGPLWLRLTGGEGVKEFVAARVRDVNPSAQCRC
ncbi:MAG: hypothetical protein HYR72_01990 [Deltaproteobacteria bacterium]|nr:hypothetical protein [Deltaproteobacteria bacterium]MBI3387438.1 hypothetical protein [Deltaproteobacteria bacterium]